MTPFRSSPVVRATLFHAALVGALQTMALDSLEASLAASKTVQPTGHAVRNEAPKVIVAYGPALLVPIEGKPVVREVPDTRFERVIKALGIKLD